MLKISTARNEITPTDKFMPCYLCGHAIRTELSTGIMDPLWVSAMVLDVEDTKMLWVTIELIGLEKKFTDRLREYVSNKYHVDFNLINISYIHSHSAPEYSYDNIFGLDTKAKEGYPEYIMDKTLKTIDECFNGEFKEVKAYGNTVSIEGCYSNRNGLDKPCDKDVITVEFRDNDKVVGGLCNFTCHSTILGPQNLLVSSDLAGYVARACEKVWGVYPLVCIGAAGDMSNRLYRKGNDLNELNRVGKEMMDQVFNDNYHPVELEIKKPVVKAYRFNKTYLPDYQKKKEQYDTIVDRINNARNFDEKKIYTSALAVATKGLKCEPFTLDLNCAYVDMGDLRYFVVPAELFSRFGVRIKEAMGAKCSILWGYFNYSVGYLGNIEDYGNSFETSSSDIPCGTTEKIVDEIVTLIKKEEVFEC